MVLGSPKQRDLLPGVTTEVADSHAEEVFCRIMPRLDEIGVTLCLEPLAPSETEWLNTCDQANALIARVDHPKLVLHMDVKAQSGEVGKTVPDLIRGHAAGRPLPRPGHEPARARDGGRRFRPHPPGPGRVGVRPLGVCGGVRLFAGCRRDRRAESMPA